MPRVELVVESLSWHNHHPQSQTALDRRLVFWLVDTSCFTRSITYLLLEGGNVHVHSAPSRSTSCTAPVGPHVALSTLSSLLLRKLLVFAHRCTFAWPLPSRLSPCICRRRVLNWTTRPPTNTQPKVTFHSSVCVVHKLAGFADSQDSLLVLSPSCG